MSPSSSGSWPSGPGDIIDLDRYMRGNVRPSRPLSDHSNHYEQLVVDGGGCKGQTIASGDGRHKRASLDSGVSDTSYRHARHHHNKHRRGSYNEDPYFYPPYDLVTKTPTDPNRQNSSSSMRTFRKTCEQALLEQQQQIARVAELCERLTERAEKTVHEQNVQQFEQVKQNEPVKQNEQMKRLSQRTVRNERKAPSVDSSDISSSSTSTKDPRKKHTHRTQECKTYKIIMTKLDELNRLFATRPSHAVRPARPRTPSSSSVSVCDKLVATDPLRTYNRVLAPTQRIRSAVTGATPASVTSAARASRHASARTVTQAYSVDIAPREPRDLRANIRTESIVKCKSSSESIARSTCDPRCGFDLDDPVHLYSQAKRLEAQCSPTQRTHSVEPASGDPWLEHVHEHREHVREHVCEEHAPSLCAVCRSYWRYLKQCVPAVTRVVDAYRCS